ncbi:hypothetical protein [Brevibacillus daliensis]|uniref:hypothetical protein n=1 Tax=Brevibacillus daliensis TaxID=2892995 RepID=UPI001E3046F1|nr:hypothetical protein [Brevibacillus daliensis]
METSIPTISFSYNLADVASAIGSNFNAIWLIVAFAVGIPLAFKFGHQIKSLFE